MTEGHYRIQSVDVDGDEVRIFVAGDDVIEMEFVEALLRLRRENESAFESIWNLVDSIANDFESIEA